MKANVHRKHLAARFRALKGKGRGQMQGRRQCALLVERVIAKVDGARGE